VEGDPRFLNPSAADFHLQGTSPAIDRGSDVDAPGIDFAGIPRPQDGNDDGTPAYDIGAYEALLFSEHAYLPSVHQMTRRQVDRIEHLAFLLLEMLGDRP
jgi:hypothetical protein